jgi:outer membrane protein TolC
MYKQGIAGLLALHLTFCVFPHTANSQVLSIGEAIRTGQTNYGTIKAKSGIVNASKASASQARKDYLPNLNFSLQQDFGTINGQNGPLYGMGLAVASSGLPLPDQNWNSAFGALYLTNVNWDFYAFGRAKEKIRVAETAISRDQSDLEQELFQHGVRVAGAYLNLLAAQRLIRSWENNLDRAVAVKNVVAAKSKNGLVPGVDSSFANAEISNAKISLTQAHDQEQELAARLAQLMGITDQQFALDSAFVKAIPEISSDASKINIHPLLQYYNSRIAFSDQQVKYFHTLGLPTLSMFGVFQGRGAGFSSSYAVNQHAYTQNYLEGIKPVRANYLIGVGATWNVTNILRIKQQVTSQKFISQAYKEEYDMVTNQLQNQLILSENKIRNAVSNFTEAPIQVQSASDAYLQKSVLYKNGLSNIVDITQALYLLNRAETSRDVAFINVWQAFLLKAAASGDLSTFVNE